MNIKEVILNELTRKKEEIDFAIGYVNNMPIEVMEVIMAKVNSISDISFLGNGIATTKLSSETFFAQNEGNNEEYGLNRKLIVQVLTENNRAMRKVEIAQKYKVLKPSSKDPLQEVTNAISALSKKGVIGKYMPNDISFRGNYWVLTNWFLDGNLLDEHQPLTYNPMDKYSKDIK